ncbi:MAG: TonB-dependent receptor plug domain-containing protein, partial [Selenomonadaceae bacterium]
MNNREKMRTQLVTAVCLGLIIGPGSMATAHGEELPEFTGEDYVVTASRIPTRLAETPANVTVITAEMIAQNHYQDLAEVLRRVNGIVVTEAAMGHQEIVRMDGDDRVAVLIDGRRMNMDKGAASGRAGIDLKTIAGLQNIER